MAKRMILKIRWQYVNCPQIFMDADQKFMNQLPEMEKHLGKVKIVLNFQQAKSVFYPNLQLFL